MVKQHFVMKRQSSLVSITNWFANISLGLAKLVFLDSWGRTIITTHNDVAYCKRGAGGVMGPVEEGDYDVNLRYMFC